MKQIENVYDAFINAWKSMAGYINKIGGDALRYARFTTCSICDQ